MLSDPLRARRISLLFALAAAVWMAVYILANDIVLDAMGDGAHALFFVSLIVFFSALITAAMFGRFARERAALRKGEALAHWRVSRAEWEAFSKRDAPETQKDQRMTLGLILFFAVVIPAGMALTGKDAKILFFISLFIMAIGFVGYGLGRRQASAATRYRDGEVSLGRDGVIVNGAFHSWSIVGSALMSATLDEAAAPAQVELVYTFLTRAGPQFATVRAPVAAAALPAARAAVARLESSDDAAKPAAPDAA